MVISKNGPQNRIESVEKHRLGFNLLPLISLSSSLSFFFPPARTAPSHWLFVSNKTAYYLFAFAIWFVGINLIYIYTSDDPDVQRSWLLGSIGWLIVRFC